MLDAATQHALGPVWLSFRVALGALLLSLICGTLAARAVTSRDFAGKDLLDGVFLLPLVLPPVVTGFVLLVLLGRRGPLGAWLLHAFGWQVLFTPFAAVLASAVVAFPLVYVSAKAAFVGLDPHLHDAAASLGAAPARVFFTVTLPLCWPGLAAGAVLAFARAWGEFGATIMVAGNIAGQTATVPIMIYTAAESGDLRGAGFYAGLSAGMNLLFVLGINVWTRRLRRAGRF